MQNMNDLRAFLSEELQNLREKKISPSEANASANLTGKIISTVKLELEYAKLVNRKPTMEFVKVDEAVTLNGQPVVAEKAAA